MKDVIRDLLRKKYKGPALLNIYAFIDRRDPDIDGLIKDKAITKKMLQFLRYKIKLLNKMKRYVLKSDTIKNRSEARKRLNYNLYNRMMSAAYISKKKYRLVCIMYLFWASRYYYGYKSKEENLLNLLSDYRKKHLFID